MMQAPSPWWCCPHNQVHQNTAGHQWRRARSKAGCPKLRLYDLRHFCTSGLIAVGCDVVTVQRALGHRSANCHPEYVRSPPAEG
jgi:integrase